ncbi:glycosyl hydrolase [Paenibacillaceae bacterium]|nr:glycosyl hydrolase [Paenibacillaceae bacterium]
MSHTCPAPLYRDPIHDGAADPTLIWNEKEQAWWMFYTSRRANVDCPGVAWCYGTGISMASSADGGCTWVFRGNAAGLEFENGTNTFWAPEVIYHCGVYHMYVSYIQGVYTEWGGKPGIIHYTSDDMWNWTYQSRLVLSSDNVIDACVHPLPEGGWRMFYKDQTNHSHTYASDSHDLYEWHTTGPVITDCPHEGPNVFKWQGQYWMITDPWNGLGVYRSDDEMKSWTRQNNILEKPGTRLDDGVKGGHASVMVAGEDAYLFYFTHPERIIGNEEDYKQYDRWVMPYKYRRTSIQAVKLELADGRIVCDRDQQFKLNLGRPDFPLLESKG